MEFKGTKETFIDLEESGINENGITFTTLSGRKSSGLKVIAFADIYGDDIDAKANAQLFVCAPELLEALQPFAELLKQFDGICVGRPKSGTIQAWHHNIHGENQLTVEMLRNAKQAIEKATKID